MVKGSQLTQLKAALNQAGLSRQPQNGKKRKRTAPDQRDKEKKAAKLKEIQEKLNPFDVKVTKLKHDVGGRKIAGTMGRPAQSKQAGMEQRKKTLLKEYEDKDRSGGIVDRRFGENDPTMNPEERMLERFTRERQRASKGVAFNLEDEDELTHYGQSLSKLDDFDNVGLGLDDDEDEESGQLDHKTVQQSHFGGFDDEDEDDEDGEPARKKSKAEVMAEVIAKSKEHKIMRQTQQEEDENLRHELDAELDSIRSLLYVPAPSATTPDEASMSQPAASGVIEKHDQDYDQLVRELAFEARAKPKDRTKTEEELALEEKEALEKAERRRIRRMHGEDDDSESEGEGKAKQKRSRVRGGDDLDDDFCEDEEGALDGLGAGLGENREVNDSEEEGETSEEDEEDEEDESSSEGEDEEDESIAAEFESASEDSGEEDGEEGESEALIHTAKKARSKTRRTSTKELPFTFPCPSTHEEFLEIVDDVDDQDVPTVVKRIRALHHPSLVEDNKFKLQGLTNVLIDHILYITSPPTPRFTLLASLVPHLFALTKAYPTQSAEYFVEKLTLMHKNLKRGLSRGATEPDSKTWPGLPELSLLRTIGIIWPTSDMSHHVVSQLDCLWLLTSGLVVLDRCKIWPAGRLVCSARILPDPDFKSKRCSSLAIRTRKAKKLAMNKPDFAKLLTSGPDEQAKVDLLGLTLDLLGRFADMYKGLEGFIELYDPIASILDAVQTDDLPSELAARLQTLRDTLGRLLKFSRQARRPLRLQAHKPIPIATYIPKFEHSSSNYLRNRDPDHERNEAAKLRNQYKQEKKGAIRELRKDARFIATEQQRKQREKDKMYNDRMKRVYGSIESERAEEKVMEREKMKEKKRSGRK
ncbi:putative nucleolar complex protein 14 [Grifola frondosa]|uniref:Putative nucleolar complex protein 14 n=1 Tax=Grifola frondosa TaxID=5627 RepID=A0A1C7M189_GRIFR|nr:putative nucleolar complex protein 14 [Grifola frondosa]